MQRSSGDRDSRATLAGGEPPQGQAGHEHLSAALASNCPLDIARQLDVKPRTRMNLAAARARLVEFFGRDRNLRDINPGGAEAWLLWLTERYASGTSGRTVKRAKQFFRAAVRSRLISENPFTDVKPPSPVNESRKHFVTQEIICQVIDACPDAERRLIIAPSRFGGCGLPLNL